MVLALGVSSAERQTLILPQIASYAAVWGKLVASHA